jgi:hypothetical protein
MGCVQNWESEVPVSCMFDVQYSTHEANAVNHSGSSFVVQCYGFAVSGLGSDRASEQFGATQDVIAP